MPLYDYRCDKCGHIESNIIVAYSKADDFRPCPKCKSALRRLPSLTGIPQFKGKGFYETDYKKK